MELVLRLTELHREWRLERTRDEPQPLTYEQALQGGPNELKKFAAIAWGWAAKADAEIERRGRKQGQKARRELAEKILLKLIEIAPQAFKLDDANSLTLGNGAELAWWIADAFLKAESLT